MVTCQATEIDGLPYLDDCPQGPRCDTCTEGRKAAKRYLAEHPGKHIAVGLVSFSLPAAVHQN
jgi:hypothetical protein